MSGVNSLAAKWSVRANCPNCLRQDDELSELFDLVSANSYSVVQACGVELILIEDLTSRGVVFQSAPRQRWTPVHIQVLDERVKMAVFAAGE